MCISIVNDMHQWYTSGMFKLHVYCPDDPLLIQRIIQVATANGAGTVGKYSKCAFIGKGIGQWFAHEGSHPVIGEIGTLTQQEEVKIEMICPKEPLSSVLTAIKEAHPYEEPAIDVIRLEQIG